MAYIKQLPDVSELLINLYSLDDSLRDQLRKAEDTLNKLICVREKLIRSINDNQWDTPQWALDDLQQNLADIYEKLAEIAPVESISQNLITK